MLLTRQPSASHELASERPLRFAVALAVMLGLPLAVYAFIGTYSRYTADDFCWAGVLRTEGFFNAQTYWYVGFSPRYAFTFLVSLAELPGPATVPLSPAAAIIVALGVATWTFRQFGVGGMHAFLLAEVATLATLQTAPDLSQSLYWQTGMLTYILPLVLATFLIGWIRQGRKTWWAYVVSGLVAFIAGGLSETYLIPQNVAITLLLLVFLALARRDPRAFHLAAALAGGVLALAVIVSAPSTASRVGESPANLWLAMSAAIATASIQILRLLRYFPLTILLSFGVATLTDTRHMAIERRHVVLATLLVALTLPFCYFPSFYAQNGNPPARSLIVPGSILITYIIFLGVAAQRVVVERLTPLRRTAFIAALALIPLGIAAVTLPEQPNAAHYAALFDAEEQHIRSIRAAGQTDLIVPPLPPNLGENFVTSVPRDWFNVCVARYYDVRSIAAAP